MPPDHQAYLGGIPPGFSLGLTIGTATHRVVDGIKSLKIQQQAFRAVWGYCDWLTNIQNHVWKMPVFKHWIFHHVRLQDRKTIIQIQAQLTTSQDETAERRRTLTLSHVVDYYGGSMARQHETTCYAPVRYGGSLHGHLE